MPNSAAHKGSVDICSELLCLKGAPVLAVDAQGRAEAMRSRLQWAADQLGLGAAQAAARLDRLAFVTLPVSGLSDVGANFLPYLLDHWRSPRKVLIASTGSGSICSCWARLEVESALTARPLVSMRKVLIAHIEQGGQAAVMLSVDWQPQIFRRMCDCNTEIRVT